MLSQSMTNQDNRVHAHVNANGGLVAATVHNSFRMNLPKFLVAQTGDDP